MKESLERVCSGCWAIILASIRLILFLGTIIFMIITIFLLNHSTHIANSLMVDPYKASRFSLLFYIYNGINFVAAIVGLYGIFNRNLVALKAFPNMLFSTTTMLSLYLIFGFAYSSEVSSARNDYLKLLNTYLPLYDWNSSSSSSPDGDDYGQKIRATTAWDLAQSEMCCGIDSYKDWDKFRPNNLASNFYPKSCCPVAKISENNGPFCVSDSDFYRRGCAQVGAGFWSSLLIYYTVFLIYELSLATLAWFYWHQFRPGNGIVLRPPGNNWQCTPEIPTSWPSNQQQQQQQSANQFGTNFTSPIYPNVNLSYQESPPSYASVANSKDTHVHKI